MRFLLITQYDVGKKWSAVIRAACGADVTIAERPKQTVQTFDDIVEILYENYDVIMLPLTLPDYNSIRLVETIHELDLQTRVILCSGTFGAAQPLEDLFDSFIHTSRLSVATLRAALEKPVARDTRATSERRAKVLRLPYLSEWKDANMRYVSAHELMHDPIMVAQACWAAEAQTDEKFRERSAEKDNSEASDFVFLSYATEDLEPARFIAARLGEAGFKVWLDRDSLLPGQDWQDEIEKVIPKAKAMIVLLSKHSLSEYGYVQDEIGMGLDVMKRHRSGRVFVIPVRLDDLRINHERLRRLHHLDMNGDRESAVEKLIATLRTVCGAPQEH